MAKGQFLSPPRTIAERYRECQVLTHGEDGSYTVHQDIHDALKQAKETENTARRTIRARNKTRQEATTSQNTAESQSSTAPPRRLSWGEVLEITPSPDTTEEINNNTEGEWRDMAGDAITTAESINRGVLAQCTLATARNLRRNPEYSISRLTELCINRASPSDILCPDWPVILAPMLNVHEVIKRFNISEVRAEELMDTRAGVISKYLRESGTWPVVCYFSYGDGTYRVYDNDSEDRQRGTYSRMRADEMMDKYTCGLTICIIHDSTELSRRLGPPITTLVTRNRQRATTIKSHQTHNRIHVNKVSQNNNHYQNKHHSQNFFKEARP